MKPIPHTVPELYRLLKAVPDSFLLSPSPAASIRRWEKKHEFELAADHREWLGLVGGCAFKCKLVLYGVAGTREYSNAMIREDEFPWQIRLGAVLRSLANGGDLVLSIVPQGPACHRIVACGRVDQEASCRVIASSFTSLLRLVLLSEWHPRKKIFTDKETILSVDPELADVKEFRKPWEVKP